MSALPRNGFVRVEQDSAFIKPRLRKIDQPRDARGCPSKKYRYLTEAVALEGLARVRRDRLNDADRTRPPECRIYFCDRCEGWHLTSNEAHPEDFNTEPARRDQEDWQVYARRLEKRIASQRAEILSLHQIGHGLSNKNTRRRMETLVIALGRATERFERERRDRINLVRLLDERCGCWWCRLSRAFRPSGRV